MDVVDFDEGSLLELALESGRLRLARSLGFRTSGLPNRSSLGARPSCGSTESRVKAGRGGGGGPFALRRLDLVASVFGATSNLPPLGTFDRKSSTNFVRDRDGPAVDTDRFYVKHVRSNFPNTTYAKEPFSTVSVVGKNKSVL